MNWRCRILGFFRNDDGAATVELAILLPLLLWPFFLTMEAGVMQMRRVMFERAVDVVARELRMGNPALNSFEAIRDAVCRETLVIPDCADDLRLEMQPVAVENFRPPSSTVECRNRSEEVKPVVSINPGVMNQLMMLRFCVLYDPLLPGTGLGARMPQVSGGGVAMIAETFYVNEP